jgi:hypothetical protein
LQHENINLVGVVDLYNKKNDVEKILKDKNINTKTLFIKNDSISDFLDPDNKILLNNFIKDCNCNAIIISTEPLAHFKYVIWALENKLHILLDKPITTEIDVSINLTKAKKLYNDYLKIEKNNSIILLSYANTLIEDKGLSMREAIVEATRVRTKPILATTLTTLGGLIPLALTDPFWEGLAFTIIFGLWSSLIFIILAFPAFYILFQNIRAAKNRLFVKIKNGMKLEI